MQNIINEIANAPELIRQSELAILEFKNAMAVLKERMSSICRTITCEVAGETLEGGKKAFSNKEERDAEVEKRLNKNESYQEMKRSLVKIETQKAQEEINLQYVRDQFSSNRYRLKLYTTDKQEKSSYNFLAGLQIAAGLSDLISQLSGPNRRFQPDNIPADCPL